MCAAASPQRVVGGVSVEEGADTLASRTACTYLRRRCSDNFQLRARLPGRPRYAPRAVASCRPCPNNGDCVCVGRPRRAVAALAGSCASTAQGAGTSGRGLPERRTSGRRTGKTPHARTGKTGTRRARRPRPQPCVLGRVLTRGACTPRLGKQSAPLVPRGHQSVVRGCCNMSRACALAPVLVLALVARSAATLTCPTSGAATSCYQGIVGATPPVQLFLLNTFNFFTSPRPTGNYNEETMMTDVMPSIMESAGYSWNQPVSGFPSLAGAVAPTATGTSTGICVSVNVTCQQLYNYVSQSGLSGGQLTQADWYGSACPAGNTVAFYVGLPSTKPCVDLKSEAQSMQSSNAFVNSLMTTLTPTICTTSNCNAPPSIPIANTTISCPSSPSATSCYTGIVGVTSVTLQNGLADALSETLAPLLLRRYNFAAPNMTKQQLAGSVTPTSMGTGSVCFSATVSCSQLFNYYMGLVAAMSPYGLGDGFFDFSLTWSQTCPQGTSVTLYYGGKAAICNDAKAQVAANNDYFYGMPVVACGTSNCNVPTAPPTLPALTIVAVSTTLSGYTAATFGPTAQGAFKTAVAVTLSVSLSAVNITSVTDVPAAGRHLLTSSINVQYTVASTLNAASVTSAITTGTTFNTALNSAFTSANKPVPVASGTSVTTISSPSSAASSIRGFSAVAMSLCFVLAACLT